MITLNIRGKKIHFLGITKLSLSGAIISLTGAITVLISTAVVTITYSDIWFWGLGIGAIIMLLGVLLILIEPIRTKPRQQWSSK